MFIVVVVQYWLGSILPQSHEDTFTQCGNCGDVFLWTGAHHEVVREGGQEITPEEQGGDKAEVVEAQEPEVSAEDVKPAEPVHEAKPAVEPKSGAVKQSCACCSVQ